MLQLAKVDICRLWAHCHHLALRGVTGHGYLATLIMLWRKEGGGGREIICQAFVEMQTKGTLNDY